MKNKCQCAEPAARGNQVTTAWKTDVLFHLDDAPAHRSVATMASVRNCGTELVDHLSLSLDLAPSYYFLFPNMNKIGPGSSIGPMIRS